jgi:CRP-like cAMP-binding protein
MGFEWLVGGAQRRPRLALRRLGRHHARQRIAGEVAAVIIRVYAPGEVLVRQGAPSDCAFFLRRGEVEVVREVGAEGILLGRVGPEEYVGEMGVLENRERSATVRAVSEVEAELIPRQEFLDRVQTNARLAHRLVLRLSSRLRDMEALLDRLHHGLDLDEAAAAQSLRVMIEAESAAARLSVGKARIQVRRFPYVVGRRAAPQEPVVGLHVDLELADSEPYRLSRAHFSIAAEGQEIIVRDLGSLLGTVVDDTALGRELARDRTLQPPGRHRVVPGGLGSPYAFAVTVED